MPSPFATPNKVFDDILFNGRGITGAAGSHGTVFSAHAQFIAIPTTYLRLAPNKAPIDDPEFDVEAFDRAVDKRWISTQDDNSGRSNNDQDAQSLEMGRCVVRVGYLFGPALISSNWFQKLGSEAANLIALDPTDRALSDATAIKRALTFSELYTGTGGGVYDPPIYLLERDGPSVLQWVPGGGRLMSVTTYKVGITISNAETSWPA